MSVRRSVIQRSKTQLGTDDGLFKAVTKSSRPRKRLQLAKDDNVDIPYASVTVKKRVIRSSASSSSSSRRAHSGQSSQNVSWLSFLIVRATLLIIVLLSTLAYTSHTNRRYIQQYKPAVTQVFEEWSPLVERLFLETIPRYLCVYYHDILPSPTTIGNNGRSEEMDEEEAEDWNPAATSTALPHDEIHAILSTAKQARSLLDQQLSRIQSNIKAQWSGQLSVLRSLGDTICADMEKLRENAENQVKLRARQAYMAVMDGTEQAAIRQAENAGLGEVRKVESLIYAIRLEMERRIEQAKRRQQSKE